MKSRSHRLGWTVALVFGLVLSAQALPASAARERAAFDPCAGSGTIMASRLPARVSERRCDLVGRYVRSGVVRLQVPPPGESVGAAAVGTVGESELVLTTEDDGDVLVNDGGEQTGSAPAATSEEPCDKYVLSGCLPPCADGNFNTYTASGNPRVKVKQPWFFKASSTPGTLTRTQALTHIKSGTQNVVNGNNDCLLPDPVSQTAPYKGKTSVGTGISVVGSGSSRAHSCGSSNGKNVVDFGALISPTLGLACWRSTSTDQGATWYIVEADIRLLKSAAWTVNPDRLACSNKVDVQGVVTHERGHAFGLAHADSDDVHSNQTMYPSVFPCSSYGRTLGLGDHAGLDFLY